MTEALTGANRSNRIDLVAEQRMRQAKASDEAKKDLEVAGLSRHDRRKMKSSFQT